MTTNTVLQEVDPDNLSTVLWDYSDTTGAANPGTVRTGFGVGGVFALNAPAVSIDTSNRLGDGSQDVTFSYDDIVSSSFRMRATATTYDNLRQGIGVLQRILAADGVMKWIPGGSSNTYYIYRKPSSIPALFAGTDRELYKVLSLFDTPEGVEIVVNRERLLRGPTLLASVNALRNGTLLLADVVTSSAMSRWAWDSTTSMAFGGFGANVSWANQSYRFTIATTGTRNFQQSTAAATAAPGDVWTFSFYAKASGGALCKAQAVLEFMSSAPAVLATATGTLTTLSTTEQRLTVTSAAAPASTDRIRVNLRWANGDATSYTVDARRAQLEKAASASQFRVGSSDVVYNNFTTNPSKSMFAFNPGDANALVRLTLTPSASSSPIAVLLGRKSEGLDVNLTEAINMMTSAYSTLRTKQLVTDATMYAGNAGDTSSQVDATSSNGAAAKTTFTNQSSLVRRWRWKSTPTDPEALHGTWDVYAAVRGETGSAYRVCMHWQAANRDPVINVEDEITYDMTDAGSSKYTPLLLGQVTFDANAGDTDLVIEGWAARDDAGANSLWWDVVYLIPADEQQALLQVPGFRRGQQATETWMGSELTAQPAGMISGASTPAGSTKVILDTQYEGVGTPPSSATTGGLVWAGGRNVVTAKVQLNNSGTALTFGSVRIRKASGIAGGSVKTWAAGSTTLGGVAIAVGMFVKPTVPNLNGRTFVVTSVSGTHTTGGAEPTWPTTDGGTVTDNPGANQIVYTETTVASVSLKSKDTYTSTRLSKSVGVDADGSTAYEGVVVFTAPTVAGRKIVLLSLQHSTQRVVDTGYAAQMLGDTEVMQTVNGTTSIDDLVKSGPFITLGPGLNVLWVDLWSLAPNAYSDIDPRDELAFHDPTQSTTVSVDIVPRYWS